MKTKRFNLVGDNNKQLNNCTVEEKNGKSTLLSYNTEVATYDHKNNIINIIMYYSSSTGRHINAFLEFYGFDKMTKKEMFTKFNLKK